MASKIQALAQFGYAVSSSQFSHLGYNPAESTMVVIFHPNKDGRVSVYRYANVSATNFDELMKASSRGSHFIQEFKKHPDVYPFELIDTDTADPEIVASKAFTGIRTTYGGINEVLSDQNQPVSTRKLLREWLESIRADATLVGAWSF